MNFPPLPLVEPLPPTLTPVEAFRRLVGLPHVVFFDSAVSDARLGRYSFVAADPFAWIERTAAANPFSDIERILAGFSCDHVPGLPPFQGGLAGLFGYELGRSLEAIPPTRHNDLPTPVLAMGAYDVVAAFDHTDGSAWLISQGFPEGDRATRRERAHRRLAEFNQTLRRPAPNPTLAPARDLTANSDLAPQFPTPVEGVSSSFSAETYLATVRRAVEYIHAGDIFQVNLSQRLLCPAGAAPSNLYLALREHNPAPYAGYFDVGQWQIASASPECFLKVVGSSVETRPIKGTRGRSLRPEADLFSGDELRASDKDRAENVMIVDLMRNDLSRVCTPESVYVDELCRLETFAFVQHLVSVVRGQLHPNATPIDLLRASFPGGSITGAPKVRAMQVIADLEPTARGPYCGSLAYLGFDGAMDASILIRTITAGRGWWQLPVGGGIVAQSRPEDEYQETWHKARGLLKAIRAACKA